MMPQNNDATLLFRNGHSFRMIVTSLEIQTSKKHGSSRPKEVCVRKTCGVLSTSDQSNPFLYQCVRQRLLFLGHPSTWYVCSAGKMLLLRKVGVLIRVIFLAVYFWINRVFAFENCTDAKKIKLFFKCGHLFVLK